MEKLKGIAFALGLILIVFFSGCVKVNIEHEIKSDGTNEMNIKYDFAELYDMGKSAYSSTSQPGSPSWADAERQMDQNMEKSCSDVKKQFAEKNIKGECSFDTKSKVLSLHYSFSMQDDPALAKAFTVSHSPPYVNYKYNAAAISKSNMLKSLGSSPGTTDTTKNMDTNIDPQQLKLMKSVVPITYTVTMPGKIIRADVGEIKDNKVVIDYYDLIGKNEAYIESQEFNLMPVIIIGAIIAVLCIVVVLVLLKRRGKKQQPQTMQQQYYGNFQNEQMPPKYPLQ